MHMQALAECDTPTGVGPACSIYHLNCYIVHTIVNILHVNAKTQGTVITVRFKKASHKIRTPDNVVFSFKVN